MIIIKKITKNNLNNFLEYYHHFHDGSLLSIDYNVEKERIEIVLNTMWAGEIKLLDDGSFQKNVQKLKLCFNGVSRCNIQEIFSWDFIDDLYVNYLIVEEKEQICFANSYENPSLYILCDFIEYEEI